MKQRPLRLGKRAKRNVRTQFAALPFRVENGKVRILLVTSLTRKRWIVPKGWPMDGCTPTECVLREAWEEAGIEGRVHPRPLGVFSYRKEGSAEGDLPVVALVYPLEVSSLAASYPEAGKRKRRWVSRKKAAEMVNEPDLAALIGSFDPEALARGAGKRGVIPS